MKKLIQDINGLSNGSWQGVILLYVIKIVAGIIILLVGFWLINRLSKLITNFFSSRHIEHTVAGFFKTLIKAILKVLLIIFVLNIIGLQTTSIVALLGAAGLAIGLALQGTLTNFAGGVMLLLFKPFKEGDMIEAQGKKGQVKDIQIFNTVLLGENDTLVIIPNSMLSNGIIENHGKKDSEEKSIGGAITTPPA